MYYRAPRKDAWGLLLIRLLLKACVINHIIKRGKILAVNSLLQRSGTLPTLCISLASQFSLHDSAAFLS